MLRNQLDSLSLLHPLLFQLIILAKRYRRVLQKVEIDLQLNESRFNKGKDTIEKSSVSVWNKIKA